MWMYVVIFPNQTLVFGIPLLNTYIWLKWLMILYTIKKSSDNEKGERAQTMLMISRLVMSINRMALCDCLKIKHNFNVDSYNLCMATL